MQTTFPAETGANLAKWNGGNTRNKRQHENTATDEQEENSEAPRRNCAAEFHVEEEKATEIKKQVQTAKNSPEAQQHRAAAGLKEVAEMQQKCSDSVKVQSCREHKSGQEQSVKTDSKTHGADMRK